MYKYVKIQLISIFVNEGPGLFSGEGLGAFVSFVQRHLRAPLLVHLLPALTYGQCPFSHDLLELQVTSRASSLDCAARG